MPPPSSASSAGSKVVIVSHLDASSFVVGPRSTLPPSGIMLELGISLPIVDGFACVLSRPRSPCRAWMICAESRRTSAGGTWARFAISRVSRVMRSTVVILPLSSGGIMCAYDRVAKFGRTDNRSIRRETSQGASCRHRGSSRWATANHTRLTCRRRFTIHAKTFEKMR